VIPLLDRLRQDLPAEWAAAEPAKWDGAWYADPVRTVYLQIGDDRLFVSARARGAISGPIYGGQRSTAWRDLRRSICEGVARLALDHARQGKSIPAVPTWATAALSKALSCRYDTLAEWEMDYRSRLVAIDAERAILSTLTLGA
jgi:hypothetical protein